MTITKVAVIGAGSMGSGIAALCASAGLDVVLLDQNAEGAQKGVDIQVKRRGFYLPSDASRITASDDYALLEDRDWVIEAIFEDLGAKHALYAAIEPHLKPSAILSSNTSTLPLAKLVEGVPVSRRERFGITHFFNPPRSCAWSSSSPPARLRPRYAPPSSKPWARSRSSAATPRVLLPIASAATGWPPALPAPASSA